MFTGNIHTFIQHAKVLFGFKLPCTYKDNILRGGHNTLFVSLMVKSGNVSSPELLHFVAFQKSSLVNSDL